MKSTFCKFARGPVPEDIQEFRAAVSVLRPIMAIRSKKDFCDFVDGRGMDVMHDKMVAALPSLEGAKAVHFSADTENLLESIRRMHDEHYYDVQANVVKRGCKSVSSHEWDKLKSGLRDTLKEAAAHIALMHIAVQECEAPHVHINQFRM